LSRRRHIPPPHICRASKQQIKLVIVISKGAWAWGRQIFMNMIAIDNWGCESVSVRGFLNGWRHGLGTSYAAGISFHRTPRDRRKSSPHSAPAPAPPTSDLPLIPIMADCGSPCYILISRLNLSFSNKMSLWKLELSSTSTSSQKRFKHFPLPKYFPFSSR
jgi:hypothetical protein